MNPLLSFHHSKTENLIQIMEGEMTCIDLSHLQAVSRGDSAVVLRYLHQFQQLIPDRAQQLRDALERGDRQQIRHVIHKMSPQLQFFGVPDILTPIRRLESDYAVMPLPELERLVTHILTKLEVALTEVTRLIDSRFGHRDNKI
jgi:HPt (histidine-containing phosphotransfer) domain-containing protein